MPRMRTALLIPLLALASPGPAAAADPPEKLRDTVLEAAMQDDTRLKAAASLSRANPEMLGEAIRELGEKRKDPRNVGFLAKYACAEEVRHLRVLAVWAAWQTAPEAVLTPFVEKTASDDEKQAARAADALGLLAPVLKDRTPYARLLEMARGDRVFAAIDAARAVNRAMDPRNNRDLAEAICGAQDRHVIKHLVWAIMDLEKAKGAERLLGAFRSRQGKPGENAQEAIDVLQDKQADDFEWRPLGLRDVPEWWTKGRPKDRKVEIAIGNEEMKAQVQGFLDELAKTAPAWGHLVGSTIHKISLRPASAPPEIFDAKKKVLYINASEISQCETPWQGAYILARDANIALCAILGEPSTGHRGWEPAYVEVHSFYKRTNRNPGKLEEFVDAAVAKKPWS